VFREKTLRFQGGCWKKEKAITEKKEEGEKRKNSPLLWAN